MKCDLALHADLLVSWAVGRASTAALTPTYHAALSSSLLGQRLSQLWLAIMATQRKIGFLRPEIHPPA